MPACLAFDSEFLSNRLAGSERFAPSAGAGDDSPRHAPGRAVRAVSRVTALTLTEARRLSRWPNICSANVAAGDVFNLRIRIHPRPSAAPASGRRRRNPDRTILMHFLGEVWTADTIPRQCTGLLRPASGVALAQGTCPVSKVFPRCRMLIRFLVERSARV